MIEIAVTGVLLSVLLIFIVILCVINLQKNKIIKDKENQINALQNQKRMTGRVEAIIDNLPGMVYQQLHNPPEYTFTYISEGCKYLTGYTSAELLGKSYKMLLNPYFPDNEDIVTEAAKTAFLNDEVYETVFKITDKNGNDKWVWVRSLIVEKKADGSPYLIEGYCTDITHQRQLEVAEESK